jgi:ATP-dependent DNA helicase RecQ
MNLETAQKALKQYFGYDTFRPMQAEIIANVLKGRDSVVLMPTGGGKSICYQIPAVIQPGLCVVVSPLIALMKDQVEGLKANGIKAAYLNSSQTYQEQNEIIEEVLLAEIKLLYVSPEKAVSEDFYSILSRVKITLFAVDEAHCISTWGHDFRPEYNQLSFFKKRFPRVPLIALTATADRLTRKDIITQMGMTNPKVFVASFDRPNLNLTALPGRNRLSLILDFIRLRPNQSGIIYCLSRKSTQELCANLQKRGLSAAFYHAGMTAKARAKVQEDFINDEVPIVCATIAFGMGIDKSNVRWVIHYNLPRNIESYYQEIGRAGRDGLKSDTLLFYSFGDVIQHRKFIEDGAQQEVKMTKLDRMLQFANALNCRRRILLNYFGENQPQNCGNCDVCINPPQKFDGTILAQKALSAIARLPEPVGINMLIDVLRGSSRKEVLDKGFDQIKTYGVGSDMSAADWQQCISQLIHLGLVEIAYDLGNALKLTPASRDVLFMGTKVEMVQFTAYRERLKAQEAKPKTKQEIFEEALFEELRQLRRQIAISEAVPPYVVFNDKTLQEMAAKFPTTELDMLRISGVSHNKMSRYGEVFIDQILDYITRQNQKKHAYQAKGSTFLVTYSLYQKGHSVEEIAEMRSLHINTIYAHLIYLFENDYA